MRRALLTIALAAWPTILGAQTIGISIPDGTKGGCATKARGYDGTNYFTAASDLHASGAFTAACWIYKASFAGGIFGETTLPAGDWSLRFSSNRLYMYGWSGGTTASANVSDTITDGTWSLAAGSYDGTVTLGASVNGAAWVEDVLAGAMDNDGGGTRIGRQANIYLASGSRTGTCFYVPSKLTAGSSSQLEAIYNGGVVDCATIQSTYGATHCYPMTGSAGANELDAIGSVDMTQINAPTSVDGPGCN